MKTTLLFIALLCGPLSAQNKPAYRVGYFTYYSNAGLSAEALSELPVNVFTHIIYFYTPYSDLAPLYAPGQDEAQWLRLRSWAHSHGIKVLMCYTGTDLSKLSDANVMNTVHLVTNFIFVKGYDGIDIDIETNWTEAMMVRFVGLLRDSLDSRGGQHKYISSYATFGKPAERATWIACEPKMDWVNVSAYDIVGTWAGYTAHYSPLYETIPIHHDGLNINASINWWKAGGYPASKILLGGTSNAEIYAGGTGLCLYTGGGCTGGAALPGQKWSTAPTELAGQRYRDWGPDYANKTISWDSTTQGSYISVDMPGSEHDTLFCFDDGRTLVRKWQYAVANAIGGLYLWEPSGTFEYWKKRGQERWTILRTLAKALPGDTLRPNAKRGKR